MNRFEIWLIAKIYIFMVGFIVNAYCQHSVGRNQSNGLKPSILKFIAN